MSLWQQAYNIAGLPMARVGMRLVSPFNKKLARGFAGRKLSFPAIESYVAGVDKVPSHKGILFHASSVGEFLQALPLMQELKSLDAARPLYLSFFSPSVEKQARSCRFADVAFYTPEDTRANMRRLLFLLKPGLIIVSKFDIWPNLLSQAGKSGIPVAVTAATLSPGSGRLRGVSAAFHRSLYPKLSLVCAISEEDSRNYSLLGAKQENCLVTGDTRFDQTFSRASGTGSEDPMVAPFKGWKNTVRLACGSIWPADQKRLLPAVAELAKARENFRFILAPHEPSREHIRQLTSFMEENSFPYELYSELSAPGAETGRREEISHASRAVIVDKIGVLAAVYRAADMAYVGGSFSTGVHNVMEPACFGLPVFMGPRHMNSYEARLMIRRGGAFSGSAPREFTRLLGHLLDDKDARRKAGEATRAVVEENLGATSRTIEALAARFPAVFGKAPSAAEEKK